MICLLAAFNPLAAAPPSPAAVPSPGIAPGGWDPCGNLQDPRALWDCWRGGQGDHEGVLATACVARTACPLLDQHAKPVQSCTYEKSWKTGFRCLLLCNYGGAFPWGSDGGNHCD